MTVTVEVGKSISFPARVVTEEALRERQDMARTYDHLEGLNMSIKVGDTAKITRAYVRMLSRFDDPVLEAVVAADGSSVTATGLLRGNCQLDIIDELSDPHGVPGEMGGVEVWVLDRLDMMLAARSAPPLEPVPISEPVEAEPVQEPGEPVMPEPQQ